MKIQGKYVFNAPREKVWEVLLDHTKLASCIPGCKKLDPIGQDQYEAELEMGVASIKGSYRGKVSIVDKQPPQFYKLLVEGTGGQSFVKGEGRLNLTEDGQKTVVLVEGEAELGGTIARVGQRLVGGAAKLVMDRFFKCMQRHVK